MSTPVTYTWPVSFGTSTFGGNTGSTATTSLGIGLLSPLREDATTGDFQRISDIENVKQCLRDGIFTNFGERIMLEAFGTIARELLFEDEDTVQAQFGPGAKEYIQRFEPRVLLNDVSVRLSNQSESLALATIRVSYTIKATNTRENLVFPFYLKPSDN